MTHSRTVLHLSSAESHPKYKIDVDFKLLTPCMQDIKKSSGSVSSDIVLDLRIKRFSCWIPLE